MAKKYQLLDWSLREDKKSAEKVLKDLKKQGHNVQLRPLKGKRIPKGFKYGIYFKRSKK